MQNFLINLIFTVFSILALIWIISQLSKIEDANTRLIKLADQIQFEKCLEKKDMSIECKF